MIAARAIDEKIRLECDENESYARANGYPPLMAEVKTIGGGKIPPECRRLPRSWRQYQPQRRRGAGKLLG